MTLTSKEHDIICEQPHNKRRFDKAELNLLFDSNDESLENRLC